MSKHTCENCKSDHRLYETQIKTLNDRIASTIKELHNAEKIIQEQALEDAKIEIRLKYLEKILYGALAASSVGAADTLLPLIKSLLS